MTATEIRAASDKAHAAIMALQNVQQQIGASLVIMMQFTGEIAAQLAEMNERADRKKTEDISARSAEMNGGSE